MPLAASHLRTVLIGAFLGIAILGVASRLFMRLLAHYDGQAPGFSMGGTLEILLYGGMIGLGMGLLLAVAQWAGLVRFRLRGLGWGLLAYLATLITLPTHIGETAAPYADVMWMVHMGFGMIFLTFGLLVARAVTAAETPLQ